MSSIMFYKVLLVGWPELFVKKSVKKCAAPTYKAYKVGFSCGPPVQCLLFCTLRSFKDKWWLTALVKPSPYCKPRFVEGHLFKNTTSEAKR